MTGSSGNSFILFFLLLPIHFWRDSCGYNLRGAPAFRSDGVFLLLFAPFFPRHCCHWSCIRRCFFFSFYILPYCPLGLLNVTVNITYVIALLL